MKFNINYSLLINFFDIIKEQIVYPGVFLLFDKYSQVSLHKF